MAKQSGYTTKSRADLHEALMPLLEAMYGEFKDLSKKSPESAVSAGKIVVVNRLLAKVRVILSEQESISFLDLPNADDMPQYSDIALLLSQYVASMKAFREKFFGWDGAHHGWFLKG